METTYDIILAFALILRYGGTLSYDDFSMSNVRDQTILNMLDRAYLCPAGTETRAVFSLTNWGMSKIRELRKEGYSI